MDDKANLDDLLEMGFIGKHEYDQRLAALTASSSQSSGSSLTTVSPLRTSAAAAGGGGGGGGGAPFQPTDPCACSTVLCACGLQIPRCLEDVRHRHRPPIEGEEETSAPTITTVPVTVGPWRGVRHPG